MIESFNGLYKWELIYKNGPWCGLKAVEWATLEYVDWFNHRRLHGQITAGPGYTTPAAFEADHYRQTVPTRQVDLTPEPLRNPGRFALAGAGEGPRFVHGLHEQRPMVSTRNACTAQEGW